MVDPTSIDLFLYNIYSWSKFGIIMLDTILGELKEGHIILHFPNQLLFFPWQRFPSLQLQWQLRMTGSCCCPSDKRPQRSKKLMTTKIVQRPTAKSPGNWVFRTRRPCHKCGRFARSILTLISQKPITLLTDFGGKHVPLREWQDSDVMTPWLGDGKQHVRVRWVTGVMWWGCCFTQICKGF